MATSTTNVDHGHLDDCRACSWAELHAGSNSGAAAVGGPSESDHACLIPELPASAGGRGCEHQITLEEIWVWPLDEHNAKLLDAVHPRSWKDPAQPVGEYDLIAIG